MIEPVTRGGKIAAAGPGRVACGRFLSVAIALGIVSLGLGASQAASVPHDAWRFETPAEACDSVAERVQGGRFLCARALPARVRSPDTAYLTEPAGELRRGFRVFWRPAKGRSHLYVDRLSKGFLKRKKRSLRNDGMRIRQVRLRGRRGIFVCFDREASVTYRWPVCSFGWRELRSSYFVLGFQQNVSRKRLRRDLRATARALERVHPGTVE